MGHSIPPRVLKENKDVFAPMLTKIFNNSISQNEFPDDLELGDITPCLKMIKLRRSVITDPLLFCPLPLKVFDPLLYSQMTGFADNASSIIMWL